MNRIAVVFGLFLAVCTEGQAVTLATLKRDGKEIQVEGRLLTEAEDGGLLVLARDGVIWAITPEELVKRTDNDAPFRPMAADELSKKILAELPVGFEVHQTAHYLVFYDTSKGYAQWCGSLFERLYLAFTNCWTRRGFELKEPEFPLVAIVFADRNAYLKFSRPDLGAAAESIIGYYHLTNNRMVMYDLTGADASRQGARGGASAAINQILSQPDMLRTVATIVHEATHQIAFNCGLHARLSDCPLWFSEGIAVYFETPDLSSAKGWRGIGAVNANRLEQFQKYLRSRPRNSLKTLLESSARFRDPKQALDAYAEAWALTYFLIHQYPKQYVAYMKALSEKKPLFEDDAASRVAQFEKAFGDLKKIDGELIRYIQKLR